MAFANRPTSTFGQRSTFGAGAGAATGGGFQRTGGGFGTQGTNQSFAQPTASRFGAGGAAPTGFGANRPTTGFGAGGAAAGGFGGGQQQQQQQQQGNGVPNYHPTDYTEPGQNGQTLKCELRSISGIDFYSQYSYEQLRWLNLQDPNTHPAQQQQGAAGGGFGFANRAGAGTTTTGTAGGFGQRTGFGAGQQQTQQTQQTGFGAQQRTGFGQQQPAAGTTGGFGQRTTGFGTQGAATTGTAGGFGARTGTGTTGFGAKTTGFGTQGAATGTTGGFGQRTGFGAGQQQQPVFQQQGAGFGGAAKTGFGTQGAGTGGFGSNSLRVATGVNRDGTTGAATTGFGARPAGGFGAGAGAGYGQQPAAGGYGAPGGGFQRTVGYGAAQPAANEPVYYTTISTAPFGILPQILKDTAAAAPKQPSETPKSTIVAGSATMSASKRKHAMLPHYKLTPRSESRQHRLQGVDAEAAGRDMFVSKMGGVKKLVIEPTDTEQSALFNPAERARLRAGIATSPVVATHMGTVPSTPSASQLHAPHNSANYMFTSPNMYAATPSFPRGPTGPTIPYSASGLPADMNQAIHASGGAMGDAHYYPAQGGPISIYTSPTHLNGGASIVATSPSMMTAPFGSAAAVASQAPKLTLPGCYTIPSISELRQKSPAELSRLPEFSIGHSAYGMVTWKTPTDVRNLNLDILVSFMQDSVEVYPEAHFPHGSPADGVLNKPATVTIFNVNVHRLLHREGKSPARNQQPPPSHSELEAIISELQRTTASFNGRFISFIPDGNKWVFEVDHFTRYGLNGSNAVNTATTTQPHSQSQTSPNPSPTRPRPLSASHHPSGRGTIPLPGPPASIKALKIQHSDSEDDSESSEPVQPLLPVREPSVSLSRASTAVTSVSGNGVYSQSNRSNARHRGSSAGSSDYSIEDDDMLSAVEEGAMSHRSMGRESDGMSVDDRDDDDEEDGEEEFGEVGVENYDDDDDDDEEYSGSESYLDHHSDFSHSDSASMHHLDDDDDDHSYYRKQETASMASHRSGASFHTKPRTQGSRSARGSAMDGTAREGTESRFSRQSSTAQPHAVGYSSTSGSRLPSGLPRPSTTSTLPPGGALRSPQLARQLGLDPRHMQQMKADFFPSSSRPLPVATSTNFQSAKRRELGGPMDFSAQRDTERRESHLQTPGWDSHASKRFKSSNATLTEVKMQTPMTSGGHMVRVLRIPPPVSSSASSATHGDAPLLKVASIVSSAESIITPVPLNNSVTKGATEIVIDPMLFQGRSMRVCWSPDGSSIYCPSFTTVKVKKVFVSPTSGPETLIPSLQAHQLLSSLNHSRLPDQLPSTTLQHNWNAFVNHMLTIVGHQTSQLHNFLSANRTPAQSLLHEAYVKLDTELNVWKLFKTLFGDIQQRELLDRFSDPKATDHLLQLARKHQLDTLLGEMTLDMVKTELLEIGKQFEKHTAPDSSIVDSEASSKSQISNDEYLANLVTKNEKEKQWAVLLCLLTGKRIKEAVSLALEMGEHRLSLMIAQLGDPTSMTSDMKRQLQSWSKEGLMGPAMESRKLAIYSILAGEVRVVASEQRIPEWIRSFALFFWYSGANPFGQSLKATIDIYGGLVKARVLGEGEKGLESVISNLKLALPVPAYVTRCLGYGLLGGSVRSNGNKKKEENDSIHGSHLLARRDRENSHLDILFHILSLYQNEDDEEVVEAMLDPLSCSPRILDFSLSWLLLSVLQAANIGNMPESMVSEVTLSFASQLENIGLWNFAFYVLLSLPSSSPLLSSQRSHAIRQLLFRHVVPLQSVLVGSLHDAHIDPSKLALLLSTSPSSPSHSPHPIVPTATHPSSPYSLINQPHLLTPQLHLWIYEALAQWYHYQGDYVNEIWMLFKCQRYNEVHNLLLNHWAPKVILDLGVDASLWPASFILALTRLEEAVANEEAGVAVPRKSMAHWTFGANLHLSFHRWFCAVKQSIQAWQLGTHDKGTHNGQQTLVDHSLLAELNQQSSSFLNLFNQYTDALQGLHQLVKQAEQASVVERGNATNSNLWISIPSLQGPAGLAMKQRTGITSRSLQVELVCAAEVVSQLTTSIASLKLLIACIDSDAPMPSPISAHTLPISALETLDCLEPLGDTFLPPDHLSSNLALLTSRYLDWRVSAL
jgi:hypothetical protein